MPMAFASFGRRDAVGLPLSRRAHHDAEICTSLRSLPDSAERRTGRAGFRTVALRGDALSAGTEHRRAPTRTLATPGGARMELRPAGGAQRSVQAPAHRHRAWQSG